VRTGSRFLEFGIAPAKKSLYKLFEGILST